MIDNAEICKYYLTNVDFGAFLWLYVADEER